MGIKQHHVVLRLARNARPAARAVGRPAGAPAPTDPSDLSVEIEEGGSNDAAALRREHDVLAVAPVMPMKLIAPLTAPAQPAAATTWGVTAVRAHSSTMSGAGVVVAVLDTGIDAGHPAFTGVQIVARNFTSDANGADQHGHGTHCAGTIFGRDVSGTRIGIARGVTKALIGKVIGADGGPSEQIVKAIQWAVSEGAHVISMSLGMDFPGFQKELVAAGMPPEMATSRALEGYRQNVLLFERLASTIRAFGQVAQPTVIVAAAGNESRMDLDPDFKIAVSPPAVSEGILSVAALGQAPGGLVVAPFSNTGALVSGPGVNVTSAKLGGGLAAMSGTSMATPHVAGVAALVAQGLAAAGRLNVGALMTGVISSGTLTPLQPGFQPADVGSGIVQAPQ
jgi:subtilisin family serine protease